MFDLFRSRDKAVRYLLGTLLGLVALSLVITLIPGFGSPSAPPEQVIADIGDQRLTTMEVQQAIQRVLKGRQVPAEMVQFYVPQLVDQMIAERAIAYHAGRIGFRVDDAELATAVRSALAQYFPTGEVDQQAYARFLAQQGMSITEFERNMRTNLLLLRLQNMMLEGIIVTPAAAEAEYRRRNEKVKLEYVSFKPGGDLKSQVQVTPEELRKYYEANRTQFTIPEQRSAVVLVADEAKIAAGLQLPEEQLRAVYNSQLDKFRTPERVHARHILLKTTEKPKDQVPQIEAKARDLLKQIRGGADFAELAKKFSEDTGSAVKGGDLDWLTRGQTVANFDKAIFSMKPKEISDLITTEYGFHIIQVLEREDARLKPFEEVKAQLAADLQKQRVYDQMQQLVEQARAELVKNPQQAEQIGAKYGLTVIRSEKLATGSPMPELGNSPELQNAIASVKAGEVTPVAQAGPNKLAVAAVTAVVPTRPAEFAEVESRVRDLVTADRVSALTQQKFKEATDKLRGMTDLQAAAKAVGGEVKTTNLFGMEGSVEGIGPTQYVQEAFAKPVGSIIGPVNVGTQVVLAKVAEKQPADMSKYAAEREQVILALKQNKATERRDLFIDGLLNTLIKEGKVKKYTDNINRLAQGYRG